MMSSNRYEFVYDFPEEMEVPILDYYNRFINKKVNECENFRECYCRLADAGFNVYNLGRILTVDM